MDLSVITHVDIEQQENVLPAADTDQSLVQIPDMTPLPDSNTVSPHEDHPKDGPYGKALITMRPPEATVVPSPEGTLKYISKYLVQCTCEAN